MAEQDFNGEFLPDKPPTAREGGEMSETPQESPCECGGPQACCCNPDTCTCARCWGETPQDHPNVRAIATGTISGAFREWPRVQPEAKALLAERDALRADLSRTLAEVERPFRERIERAEAALREIEQATEGIPEQNCALANHIASVALAGRLKP